MFKEPLKIIRDILGKTLSRHKISINLRGINTINDGVLNVTILSADKKCTLCINTVPGKFLTIKQFTDKKFIQEGLPCFTTITEQMSGYDFNDIYKLAVQEKRDKYTNNSKTNIKKERVQVLSIEEVFTKMAIEESEGKKLHRRLETFYKKGLRCIAPGCDRVGTFFALEKWKDGSLHIDLYTENNILMTVDHDMPRSKGGSDDIENKNPMCCKCNSKKKDMLPEIYWKQFTNV
jgi:hypothetical protein